MSKHALILCGGLGTRFRDVSSKPKILAPFKKAKFLDWLIMYVERHGFSELTLSLGYKADHIIQYVEEKIKINNKKINYCIESIPLGTGGAIKNFIDNYEANEVFVLNGDTFWPDKIPTKFIKQRFNIALCLTNQLKYNDRFGDFKIIDGKLQYQRGSIEKPIRSSESFVGICKVDKNINFSGLKPPFSLEKLLMHPRGGVELFKSDIDFFDFGTAQAYRDLLTSANN